MMDFPLLPLITVWWRVPHVSPLVLDIGTIDGAWHCWKQPIGWRLANQTAHGMYI